MFSQGYIGVSVKGAKARFREHKSAANNGSTLPVHNFIRKYGSSVVVTTVVNAPIEYCYEIEQKLRPTPNIGYNVSAGGESTNLGSRRSDESRAKMSASRKGKRPTPEALANMQKAAKEKNFKHSEEAKKKISDAVKARGGFPSSARENAAKTNSKRVAWLNTFADESAWKMADKVFEIILKDSSKTAWNVGKELDIRHCKFTVMIKKIKSGWNPNEDKDWLIFSGKLTPESSGDKPLQTGDSPTII